MDPADGQFFGNDATDRSALAQSERLAGTSGGLPTSVSARSKLSSMSASWSGRKKRGQVTLADPVTVIINSCLSNTLASSALSETVNA